ncbi:TetR/AcrR family transcriptional regulator [Vibrio vulnificus]|nr:TetR/AcrR family transcriptional regulator [Vibrio vulnificus]HAS8543471.1 TetR/AcrR family transcriptional regulator [Vibrio vulnificus]
MSQKRQQLIDTALELFYRNGIHSIGINEVLHTSGVAKRTLYSHFKSKDELVLAALTQRHQVFVDWLQTKLALSTNDQTLTQILFDALASWFNGTEPQLGAFRGCFFINTSAEFSDLEADIFQFCQYHKRVVRDVIAAHLTIKDESLLDAICLLKEGAIVTTHLTGKGDAVIAQCLNTLNRLQR